MKMHNNNLLKLLSLTGMAVALVACSSDPAPWTKADSPWDQRRNAAEAPAADSYKADLEMGTDSAPVELSYQAESVDSFAPEMAMVEEPAPMEAAPVIEAEPDTMMATGSLLDVPANYYTVQLMASVDLDRVYRFADQHQLSTQYVVPTVRDGVTWHVLLLDVYPDYASAVAGKDEVVGRLTTQPWIRKVGSVQKLMQ